MGVLILYMLRKQYVVIEAIINITFVSVITNSVYI